MAAAANRHEQVVIAGECNPALNIVGAGALRDERRALDDHRIPDLPRGIVPVVGLFEHPAPNVVRNAEMLPESMRAAVFAVSVDIICLLNRVRKLTSGACGKSLRNPYNTFPFHDRARVYLFGRFRLSADGTMLLRDGAVIPLAPKALRTLLTLVEHAGEVVTKQHLLETVWPDSFVEDTGLTRNISVIRQALGEEGERFIVTVARLGYRFTAQVERIEKDMTPRASRIAALARGDRSAPMVGRRGRARDTAECLRECRRRAGADDRRDR